MASEENPHQIHHEISRPILLAERVRLAVDDADSFKSDCSDIGKQADRLAHLFRSLVRFATSTPPSLLYDRPIRRIVSDASNNLNRALTLVLKCKRHSVLRRVVTITNTADFRKLSSLLDSSLADLKWLLSVFDSDAIVLSLPPIASNDPILAWVWSFIATVQMSQRLADRVDAAAELASLAKDNDRNKTIIVEEGAVAPLLKLLKEDASSEAQIAAATALSNIAGDREKARAIVDEDGVSIIVQVLCEGAMSVQTRAATLVARMARYDSVAQEEFARASVIRPLATLLSFEDDLSLQAGKQSIDSVVKINKEMEKAGLGGGNNKPVGSFDQRRSYTSSFSSASYTYSEGSSRGRHSNNTRKDRENEPPLVKLQMKVSCAEALWMLARGSISNSRRITETKGLLCLAKLVEKEQGELQYNCLMAIMMIADAAESNADLRRAAFKTNSPAAKAVVEQLVRIVKEVDSSILQIPSIKAIGSLARTFPARETWVIEPLVTQLGNKDIDVATEAAIALEKFACSENFLCVQHSKTIVEFNAVPPLMRLLRGNERSQLHGLLLLCYLALHADNTDALGPARVLTALEGADHAVNPQHPELRELVQKAIYHLNLYHSGGHSRRFTYVP